MNTRTCAGPEVTAGRQRAACPAPAAPVPRGLTVRLGQLYFSKTSCTRSSPPSVNIMIILLQLARVMLDWAGVGAGSGGSEPLRVQRGWAPLPRSLTRWPCSRGRWCPLPELPVGC